jgi:hypothetical protein
MSEVLPAPLGPSTATISPGPARRSTPASAVRSPYRFTKPTTSIIHQL